MIRLIALDVDGTLLDSRWQVPEANREAIRRATAAGVEVALVTGRRFDFARPVIDQIDSPLTLIVSGGALVKSRDGRSLVRHLLPRNVAHEVLAVTRPYREAAALVFDRPKAAQVIHESLDTDNEHRRSYFDRNRDFLAEVVPLEAALTEDPVQVMFSGDVSAMRAVVSLVEASAVAAQVALAVTEYESRDFSLVDVNRGGCTKGTTLAAWAEARGIQPDEVMAIGDNFNDIEMLEFAGLPVVMANAVPALKRPGWAITASNDEAGVAAAIDRYVLGNV